MNYFNSSPCRSCDFVERDRTCQECRGCMKDHGGKIDAWQRRLASMAGGRGLSSSVGRNGLRGGWIAPKPRAYANG
jgi:hypothetical protein